jgi:cytochrome oxidase Cu insertion factor (SCO1/SenC/PrrC family)
MYTQVNIINALSAVANWAFGVPMALVAILSAVLVGNAVANGAEPVNPIVERASDFTLIDQHGKAFNLHYHEQVPAIVL